jgi:hypothetical protein
MFSTEHSVPAQLQHGNSKVRLEPDFAAGRRAFFALIEEPLGQEKQADWCPDLHKREVVGHAPASATDSATVPVRGIGLSSNYETNSWPQAPFLLSPHTRTGDVTLRKPEVYHRLVAAHE